jgi:hypothetical protein
MIFTSALGYLLSDDLTRASLRNFWRQLQRPIADREEAQAAIIRRLEQRLSAIEASSSR